MQYKNFLVYILPMTMDIQMTRPRSRLRQGRNTAINCWFKRNFVKLGSLVRGSPIENLEKPDKPAFL